MHVCTVHITDVRTGRRKMEGLVCDVLISLSIGSICRFQLCWIRVDQSKVLAGTLYLHLGTDMDISASVSFFIFSLKCFMKYVSLQLGQTSDWVIVLLLLDIFHSCKSGESYSTQESYIMKSGDSECVCVCDFVTYASMLRIHLLIFTLEINLYRKSFFLIPQYS